MNHHTAFHQSLLLTIFLSKQDLHVINIRLKHLGRWRFGTHSFVLLKQQPFLPALPFLVQVSHGGHTFRNPSHPPTQTWMHHYGRYSLELLSISLTFKGKNRAFSFSEFSTEYFLIPHRGCQRFLKHILLNEQN